MNTLRINPNSRYDRKIRIGFEGENAVSRVDFDMTDWQTKYGEGSLVLFVIRPRDTVPYPVSLSIVDGIATWNITSTDCARRGNGAIQLKYTVSSVVKKSYIYATSCHDALDETDTIPDGYESWLANLTDLAALCESYAVRAENAVERAEAAINGYVTPEMYGAKGDGVTDDTEAIQNAINSGGILVLSSKTYKVVNTIILPNDIKIIGDNINESIILWDGGVGEAVLSTEQYPSTPDISNKHGYIKNITIKIPFSLVGNETKGLYICEPNVDIENVMIRMGNANMSDAPINGSVAIELDGCSNTSPFNINHVRVIGQFEKGFYIRTSHATLTGCQSAYGKYGYYVDSDSQNSQAGPPYCITFVYAHSYHNTTAVFYVNDAKNINILSSFIECENTCSALNTSNEFIGFITIDNVFRLHNNAITSPNGNIEFIDSQNNYVMSQFKGSNNNKISRISRGMSYGEWGGSATKWLVAVTDTSNRQGLNGGIDITIGFLVKGSGNVAIEICRAPTKPTEGVYSPVDGEVSVRTFEMSATVAYQSVTFHFLLENQNISDQYWYFTITGTDYITVRDKYIKVEAF